MWQRVLCFFLGHEKWSSIDGGWYCMRCKKVHRDSRVVDSGDLTHGAPSPRV